MKYFHSITLSVTLHNITMLTTLIGLSVELKLSIYSHLGDLDDALHLSQTCKQFHRQQRIIQRQVIVRNFLARNGWYL